MQLGKATARRVQARSDLFDRVAQYALERGDPEFAARAAYWAQLARMTAQMGLPSRLR
jgi:hypothetical protein